LTQEKDICNFLVASDSQTQLS